MIKFMKKSILIITTLLLTIALSACGNKSITAEEALTKSTEASKNMKSTEFTSNSVTEMISGEQTRKIETKLSGSLIIEPLAMHTTTELKNQNQTQNVEMYLKDGAAYIKATGQNQWIKNTSATITAQFENMKKLASSDEILNFYKKVAKDFKITEENGNYVLTYSGSGEQFKDLISAVLKSSGSGAQANSILNNVEFKNVSIKYVVKKNDFTPISNETTMELTAKNSSNNTMKMTQNITYSNVNKVSEITLPDEAKNAKEVK
ncbi:DUF6612 family protein [Gemella cuniculi]|uniref:DUF6612 family protein n=1 Tax=Gemella cuniculi TaxID=150240 RepID=UPI000400A8AF|nr:DUF6612 family protein [Gemella cuniculi]